MVVCQKSDIVESGNFTLIMAIRRFFNIQLQMYEIIIQFMICLKYLSQPAYSAGPSSAHKQNDIRSSRLFLSNNSNLLEQQYDFFFLMCSFIRIWC